GELKRFGYNLQTNLIIRVHSTPIRIGRHMLSAYIDSVVAQYPLRRIRQATAEGIRNRHVHTTLPPVVDAKVGSFGEIWLRVNGQRATDWYVFGPDGEMLGIASVPPNLRILDMSSGTVVALAVNGTTHEEELVVLRALPAGNFD